MTTFCEDIGQLFDMTDTNNRIGPVLLVCLIAITVIGVGVSYCRLKAAASQSHLAKGCIQHPLRSLQEACFTRTGDPSIHPQSAAW